MKEKEIYHKGSKSEHLDENELALYVEYLRNETDRVPEKLIRHVETCSYCRAELMAITDLVDSLPEIDEEVSETVAGYHLPGFGRHRRAVISVLRAVAAVAAVVLVAWFIQRIRPDQPDKEQVAVNKLKDSTGIIDKDTDFENVNKVPADPRTGSVTPDTVLYAEAFVPYAVYENLVSAKYRSGNEPQVAGPDPGKAYSPGDTLNISWTADPGDEYLLIILDNKARPVKEIRAGPVKSIAWKIELKPGLYYWKFLGREEMWKVGKIRVMRRG